MKEYLLTYKPNNIETLHARMQAVFGDRYDAMGSSDEGVWFRFKDDGLKNDKATLQAELDAHDPKQQSLREIQVSERKAARDRLSRLNVAALRSKVGLPLKRDELLHDILDILEDLQQRDEE